MMNNKTNASNFIRSIIADDLANGKHKKIITRFPPEPNGYLHIGHLKAICINFGLAKEFNGECNLRFDDTNPSTEEQIYVDSIKDAIRWLGFEWTGSEKYASDYFEMFYQCAIYFIQSNLAYVCDLTLEQWRDFKGDFTKLGKNSPYRDRSVDENMVLFEKMRSGAFASGEKVLRLKIDMQSANMNMRDPVIYRIKHENHIRTKDKWCIYPMYDYAHCISDALEGITHSLCTLEFEDHRPLYDWIIDHLYAAKILQNKPRQIEFARLIFQDVLTSKRKLAMLVKNNIVNGWEDPRMPTIVGMKNLGYLQDGLKCFIERCGVSKAPNLATREMIDIALRDTMEPVAPKIMAVTGKLIRIVLTNFDEKLIGSRTVALFANNINHNLTIEDPTEDLNNIFEREVVIDKEIYIQEDDFCENPDAMYHRLSLNKEVRLRYSYIIKCNNIIHHNTDISVFSSHYSTTLECTIDYDTLGKNPLGRKVKGVIHWIGRASCVPIKIYKYDSIIKHNDIRDNNDHNNIPFDKHSSETYDEGYNLEYDQEQEYNDEISENFEQIMPNMSINYNSVSIQYGLIEKHILEIVRIKVVHFHFERVGFFKFNANMQIDNDLSFNHVVSLKSSW